MSACYLFRYFNVYLDTPDREQEAIGGFFKNYFFVAV